MTSTTGVKPGCPARSSGRALVTSSCAYKLCKHILAASAAAAALSGNAYAHTSSATERIIVASQAATKRSAISPRSTSARQAQPAALVTTAGTAPGQTGYVHYFVITGPDGEPESQVGIELPNDRIAWSFPELGVVVSPFIPSGQITANGKAYEVEHLYGIRPFRDDESLRALQRDLADRVAWWVNEKTPYCDEERPASGLCVSCLGFALRVLYPGSSPAMPAPPADFKSLRRNIYTTEDLLLYLAGVRVDGPREARLKRIQALSIPESMREELVRIATLEAAPGTAEALRAAVAKPKSTGRSMVQSPRRAVPRRGS